MHKEGNDHDDHRENRLQEMKNMRIDSVVGMYLCIILHLFSIFFSFHSSFYFALADFNYVDQLMCAHTTQIFHFDSLNSHCAPTYAKFHSVETQYPFFSGSLAFGLTQSTSIPLECRNERKRERKKRLDRKCIMYISRQTEWCRRDFISSSNVYINTQQIIQQHYHDKEKNVLFFRWKLRKKKNENDKNVNNKPGSTNFSIKPPMWRSPRTRSVFSTWRSVIKIRKFHVLSPTWIIFRPFAFFSFVIRN